MSTHQGLYLPVLAFDTSGPWCACALLTSSGCVTRDVEMSRGQAEHLMPLLENMLDDADLTWGDLTRIGVGIGPGNFTGIRIAVSAARGLALGLDLPAIGVSSFDAVRGGTKGMAAVPAPRNMAYLVENEDVPQLVPKEGVPGSAAWVETGASLVGNIARIAAATDASLAPAPAPLYLRAADAAPPRDAPPVILDDA